MINVFINKIIGKDIMDLSSPNVIVVYGVNVS